VPGLGGGGSFMTLEWRKKSRTFLKHYHNILELWLRKPMKYTLLKTQRTSGWHLKYGSLKLPLYPQRYEDVQGSGCEAVGITDFGKRWRWIARLHPSVGSLHLAVGLQIGWVPWANVTSFSSWHLTLVVESLYKSGTDSCACVLAAVSAYWQRWQNELCLLTDNSDRTSCACLLTTVTERAVSAYWQRW